MDWKRPDPIPATFARYCQLARHYKLSTGVFMGLFWDLVQQTQIADADNRAGAIEQRVVALENELLRTRQLLHEVVTRLELSYGTDIDRDGYVGDAEH